MIKLKGKTCNKPHIYKITNDINGKFYYGVHNGNDTLNYEGTSTILKKSAYKKHGKENFTKEILMWFNTEKEAYEYEGVIVNQAMIDNPMCYNLQTGGLGFSSETAKLSGKRSYERKVGIHTENVELLKEYSKAGHDALKEKHGDDYFSKAGKHMGALRKGKPNPSLSARNKEKHLCKWGCGKSYNAGNLGQHEKKFCKLRE